MKSKNFCTSTCIIFTMLPVDAPAASQSSVYLFYWYKSTNTDAYDATSNAPAASQSSVYLFYWYKVQILKPTMLPVYAPAASQSSVYTFFDGTKVQILTRRTLIHPRSMAQVKRFCVHKAHQPRPCLCQTHQHTSAYVSSSRYVSIRQHTSAAHASAYVSIRQQLMRQHTSAYVSSSCVSICPQLLCRADKSC
jgi:hypothetical protein